MKPRHTLAIKAAVSVFMAAIAGLWAGWLAAAHPPWVIGSAVAGACLFWLIKAAFDDYEREVQR